MAPEFVDRMRGSKWMSALPTEEISRFNLWRPTVVDRTSGSNRVQAPPARPLPLSKNHI